MDWRTYKRLCDQANYWSAWMLEQCCQLLNHSDMEGAAAVADVLRHDLRTPALERPADHSGDKRSSMHRVSLTETQCRLLLAVIQRAKDTRQFTCDTRKRGLGGFAESCEELLLWRVTKPNGCQYDRA